MCSGVERLWLEVLEVMECEIGEQTVVMDTTIEPSLSQGRKYGKNLRCFQITKEEYCEENGMSLNQKFEDM